MPSGCHCKAVQSIILGTFTFLYPTIWEELICGIQFFIDHFGTVNPAYVEWLCLL